MIFLSMVRRPRFCRKSVADGNLKMLTAMKMSEIAPDGYEKWCPTLKDYEKVSDGRGKAFIFFTKKYSPQNPAHNPYKKKFAANKIFSTFAIPNEKRGSESSFKKVFCSRTRKAREMRGSYLAVMTDRRFAA